MQINSIRAANIANRVMIEFNSGLILPLLVDDVVILKLSKGQELDDSLFTQIVYKSAYYLLRNSALIQINNSPKTEKILFQKLRLSLSKILTKYNFPQGVVNYSQLVVDLVSDFKDKGLLNDDDFVQYFVRKNHSKSRIHISHILQSYGINITTINKYLPSNTSQKTEISKILAKKKITPSDLQNFNTKNKITASLFRKGFGLSDIRASFDDLLNNR